MICIENNMMLYQRGIRLLALSIFSLIIPIACIKAAEELAINLAASIILLSSIIILL